MELFYVFARYMEKNTLQNIGRVYRQHQKMLSLVFLVLLLLVSAILRLYNIAGYMTFLGDEGRDVLVVKRILVDHKLTLLGPTASVGGFFMGPIYYYFMLPFLWLWRLDPVGPAIMVALFGVATVYMVYRIGRDFFDEETGYFAAGLYALSPLVIAYSRSSWNPNLVPFFSAFLLYTLLQIGVKYRWKWTLWAGVILGIGLQLHYLFLFLFPVVAFWICRSLRDKIIPSVVLGIGGFIIGYAPFLAFELRHGFPNTVSIWQFLASGKDTGFSIVQFLGTLSDVIFRVFGRLLLRIPDPGVLANLPAWQIAAWVWSVRLAIIAVVAILLSQFVSSGWLEKTRVGRWFASWKENRANVRTGLLLLSAWFAIVLFLFGLYKRAIYDYYFGILFVLPFLLLGYVLARLWRYPKTKYIALGLWGLLLLFNWQGRPFRYAPNQQLAQTKRIAQEAYAQTEGKPFNFALITGNNSDHAYRYFFEIWDNAPVTIENTTVDPDRHTVTDQLIVICETPDCRPLGHPLWEIAGFGRAQIVGRWEVPFVEIYKLIHYKGE